jgi:hypothetical protein
MKPSPTRPMYKLHGVTFKKINTIILQGGNVKSPCIRCLYPLTTISPAKCPTSLFEDASEINES